MGFTFAHLKRVPPLAVALAAVFSVQAQHPTYRPGQPILFSTPASDTVSSNTPSLSPRPPESLDLGSTLQAPASVDFNGPVVDIPLPAVPPMISPGEEPWMQDELDRRKNWLLLTPAEILGATTPEKILGIQEHDSYGRPKNSTALERYLERQNQPPTANADTNAFSTWNFSDQRPDVLNATPGGLENPDGMAGTPFNPAPDRQTSAGENGKDHWSRLFDTPPPASMPSMAQQTDMDRFRQLLNSGSSATAVPETPALSVAKSPLPQTVLSSGLGQSALTPVGAAFTPLNSGIGKPAEMPKLPSIWSQSLTSPPSAAVWAPQPPPWLSPTPQPFAAPQRKF
jgi:hypothetical protein